MALIRKPLSVYNIWQELLSKKACSEIQNKTDWSLVIAHLLGVDHCGHTFGSLTPHIGLKLSEVDLFIESIVNMGTVLGILYQLFKYIRLSLSVVFLP